MKKNRLYLLILIIILVLFLFFLAYNKNNRILNTNKVSTITDEGVTPAEVNQVQYVNQEYGFGFNLPSDWLGYTVATTEWEGYSYDETKGDILTETGPIIHIRDPKYTDAIPRQDIPVMILTLKQWQDLQNDEFHIGAAPVNPTMLGENYQYVFALPARYNFALLPGYEEVDRIIENDPLFVINQKNTENN